VLVDFMARSIQQPKELESLKQLIGEWSVGIALKVGEEKIVSGCGEMTAVEIREADINSEIDAHIEGYDDYYENDLWSFDRSSGKVHLFSITSEGDVRDHVGNWKDNKILELYWRGTYEDQELEEAITATWLTENQIEVKETHSNLGKVTLTVNYVFKRK